MTSALIITSCLPLFVSIVTVYGSGCQHQCDCGFKWPGDENLEEKALRYEVIGGLCGGFGPLLIAGICYLVYKKCRQCGSLSLSKPYRDSPWKDGGLWAGGRLTPPGGFDRPRGSTPISLYGETEDSFITGNSSFPNNGSNPLNSAAKPDSSVARYTNVHRNHPGNEINQWFKNVNTMKY